MGLAASKVCKQIPREDLQEGSIPSTPILAPKMMKQEELDPRSPSTHISRTPLQLLSAATLKLNELKEDLDTTTIETPAKSKAILLGIDPRSPTTEFKRTPIVVNALESDTSEKIRNKALDRVRKSVINTPKTPQRKGPKLLESSPIKGKVDTNKRKSFVGLLETNIDFTETDLDEVIRAKNKIREASPTLNEPVILNNKRFTNVVETENIDPRSPTSDFLRTPIIITKKITNLDLNDEVVESESKCTEDEINQNEIAMELQDHNIIEKCVQEICETVHLNTEKDLIVQNVYKISTPKEIPSSEVLQLDQLDNKVEEIIMEIKSAPITPPTIDTNIKATAIAKEIKSAPVTPPTVSIAPGVRELDKKLTSLIYQDEDIVICPRKVKLKDYDCRSPLRNLNSNEPEKKKSAQKTKLHEMKKSDYTVSRIPVFKEKCKKSEIQCENTPPRNLEKRKVKVKKSHWDNADTTLII